MKYQSEDNFTGMLERSAILEKEAEHTRQKELATQLHNLTMSLQAGEYERAGFVYARCDPDIDHILPLFIMRKTFNKMMKTLE